MSTMTVTVINRGKETNYDYGPHFERVTIDTSCPVCGKPRGEPYPYRFCEDGEWYTVDRWDNPCGHIDTYRDAIREGK